MTVFFQELDPRLFRAWFGGDSCYTPGMNQSDNNSGDTAAPILRFFDVSFTWPDPETGEIGQKPVFDAFTADIPGGFVSLTGPNGVGKSTFMLLAGGRLMPSRGRIELAGENTRILSGVWADEAGTPGPGLTADIEHERNLICSFIYQNMEIDASGEESPAVGALLEQVLASGGHAEDRKKGSFLAECHEAFELEGLLGRSLGALSKGELQRVLLAFSALYGSELIMMDEPMFAMEMRQKEKALVFFKKMHRETGVSVFVSLHELFLTRKYADTVMLFHPDRTIDMGTPEEVLTKEALEAAYGVPEAMLYDAEKLTRGHFAEEAAQR